MIAISYRREDSLPIAGRLYDRLQAKFGKHNVFMDFDSIPPGVDFRNQIKETIERSTLVIALIGPHWLGERSDGLRRIDDPTDFVRLEIQYALEKGIPVIPLLINSTPMPDVKKLPEAIQALAFRNALPLDSGLDFHIHVDRLIGGVANTVAPVKSLALESADEQARTKSLRRSKNNALLLTATSLAAVAFGAWLLGVRLNRNTLGETKDTAIQAPKDQAPTATAVAMATPSPPVYIPIPSGYTVLQFTVSPNSRYGVIAPDADHYIQGAFQHQVIELPTGRAIGLIQADTGLVDSKVFMNRGSVNPARWSEDSNVLLWEVEGRWSPRALVLLRIAENGTTIAWQLNLLKVVQQEILSRTKRVSPKDYAKAAETNKGNGSAFPDGFVVPVRAKTPKDAPVTFPIPIHAGLTSNPKGFEPGRVTELNSELDGLVDSNGKFSVTKFGLSDKPGWQIATPPETLPSPIVVQSPTTQAPSPKPTSSPKAKRLFAGTWEGTQHPFDDNGKALPSFKNTFTVNETETEVTMAQGGPLKGWIKSGARTLSLTMFPGKFAQHHVIVVTDDGRAATYKMDTMGYTVYRGTFHKKN